MFQKCTPEMPKIGHIRCEKVLQALSSSYQVDLVTCIGEQEIWSVSGRIPGEFTQILIVP